MHLKFRKQDHYDEKCDIWSLGVMIYQMIYGISPFIPKKGTIENLLEVIKKGNVTLHFTDL